MITYQIAVTNNGISTVNGAVIMDAMPAGIDNITATVSSQTGGASGTTLSVTGNTVNGTIAVIPAGGVVNIAISGMVTGTGTLNNIARVTPPPGTKDPVPGNNTAAAVTTVTPGTPTTAKLSITKTVTPVAATYNPGDNITYTLTVTNNGAGVADAVVVTDVIPTTLLSAPALSAPSSGTANYNTATQTITWNIGHLENTQTVTLSYAVTVTDTGVVKNVAIASGTPDVVIPDTATHIITVGKAADLVVSKKIITAGPYSIGQRVDYSIDITNKGPNTATGVVVTDALPAGDLSAALNITTNRGNAVFDAASNTLFWTVGDMNTGEMGTLSFHTQIIGAGDITNSAVITGNEPDPDFSNNTSIVTVAVKGDIFIPNVITPNGDGKNDRFVITGLNKYPGSSLFIYNRWGNMVYQSKNYDNRWAGEGLNDGTYYYVLKLRTPQGERNYKGWIELLRN
jgi:gliding motility-associated-like protein/uncharacterized repeat protein (TIGR01451 family)